MIICPIQNTANQIDGGWEQVRPRISQGFGENPVMYQQFGLDGHNGTDYAIRKGTKLFAPIDSIVKIKDSGDIGYGLHIKLRLLDREVVIGHMDDINDKIPNYSFVRAGELLGVSGNTGYSTGDHTHLGFRNIDNPENIMDQMIFSLKVSDYDNGYFGYWDVLAYIITWKGTSLNYNL